MKLKTFIIWSAAIYLLLSAGFSFYQHLFFFHPKALPTGHIFNFNMPFEEKEMKLDKTTTINYIIFKTKDTLPKGVVLYFHGNQENVEHYAANTKIFTDKGYECWMPDYPTYGKSTGALSQQNMENTAIQLYKMVKSKYAREHIIIYGKSLGTGLAAYLASTYDCKQLILETPYYSLSSLTMRYTPFLPVGALLKMDFTTGEYLKNVIAPVTIFHGLQDDVIPFTNAMQLLKDIKKGDYFVPIPDGVHNNLPSKPLYQRTIDSLLSIP